MHVYTVKQSVEEDSLWLVMPGSSFED